MKQLHLWLTVPLIFLLTACSANTHSNESNLPGNLSSTNNAVNPASNSAGTPPNPTANSTDPSATAASPTPTFATQVYVSANTYTTASQNVVYPQLHGLPDTSVQSHLNVLLKKSAIYAPTKTYSKPGSYTYSSSYNVVFEQGNIMNIVYSSYFYPTGAAHGMPAHESLIFNLKTGQTYSLTDLFQAHSDYLQKISQVVEKEDTNHMLDTFQKFTGVTQSDTMFLREGGFVVDFSPYEWASYAQGFLDYYVPFSTVNNVVNAQSSLWKALNDSTGFPSANYRSEEQQKIVSLGYLTSLAPEDETMTTTAQGDTLSAWVGGKRTTSPTGSGSTYVFFFLNGQYLGTDTSKPHGYVEDLYPDGAGTIAVTYDNYSSNGTDHAFTIHYDWNGSKLVAAGSFPSGFGTSN